MLGNGGQSLAPTLRRDVEERFGADFSRVRVDDTPRAADPRAIRPSPARAH